MNFLPKNKVRKEMNKELSKKKTHTHTLLYFIANADRPDIQIWPSLNEKSGVDCCKRNNDSPFAFIFLLIQTY